MLGPLTHKGSGAHAGADRLRGRLDPWRIRFRVAAAYGATKLCNCGSSNLFYPLVSPAKLISMAEDLDFSDDSVCDLTEPEVIDLSADDTDLAAQLNAQLDEYIVIDSDSDDDVQFVSQSPPKRRKVDEEEVTFVKSTPPVHDVDADEALARKLHEQINGDVEVVARPTPPSKPSAAKKPSSKKRPKNEGPFGGRDVLKKQRTGLFEFLSKKAKSLRIVDVVPNPHSEPGKPLYERFLSAYTFATTKKVKLLFHGSPPQNIPNILANGLDPNRRGASSGQRLGSGEYFGTHAEVSTEYCGGGRQMIVFAVGTCVEINQ